MFRFFNQGNCLYLATGWLAESVVSTGWEGKTTITHCPWRRGVGLKKNNEGQVNGFLCLLPRLAETLEGAALSNNRVITVVEVDALTGFDNGGRCKRRTMSSSSGNRWWQQCSRSIAPPLAAFAIVVPSAPRKRKLQATSSRKTRCLHSLTWMVC